MLRAFARGWAHGKDGVDTILDWRFSRTLVASFHLLSACFMECSNTTTLHSDIAWLMAHHRVLNGFEDHQRTRRVSIKRHWDSWKGRLSVWFTHGLDAKSLTESLLNAPCCTPCMLLLPQALQKDSQFSFGTAWLSL